MQPVPRPDRSEPEHTISSQWPTRSRPPAPPHAAAAAGDRSGAVRERVSGSARVSGRELVALREKPANGSSRAAAARTQAAAALLWHNGMRTVNALLLKHSLTYCTLLVYYLEAI